jgi:hypothetical protein
LQGYKRVCHWIIAIVDCTHAACTPVGFCLFLLGCSDKAQDRMFDALLYATLYDCDTVCPSRCV